MARDMFHDLVKTGLEAEGWTITADPLYLSFGRVNFEVDLAAERVIAAERANRKIAVEIKSFLKSSFVTDFYSALGQFLSYRLALQKVEPDRELFLAVPLETYERFFSLEFTQSAIQEYSLRLIIYDSEQGGLARWID
jgi:hypothetical protein